MTALVSRPPDAQLRERWFWPVPPAVRRAFWTSRVVVLLSGWLAVLEFGLAPGYRGLDPSGLTSQGSAFGNLLAAPVARWDAVWYLSIAQHGYSQTARTAFYPLYPLLVRGAGWILGSQVIAGAAISLTAFLVALVLLHRLATLELGPRAADRTVLLLAFAPVAFFFSALYTESLFLALSVGCLLAAREGRWAVCGVLGGLASASRNAGIALLVPALILFAGQVRPWRSRRLLWLALIPAGMGSYLGYLALANGDGLAPFHVQALWFRHLSYPGAGAVQGLVAAWDGLRQLLHGPAPPVYFRLAGGDPLLVGGQNLMLFGFLVLGVMACAGALRRLPLAYGAYAAVSLLLALSDPVSPQPLASLPRYELVIFPLFMWAAERLALRRALDTTPAWLGVLLGFFTAMFATWRFVA